jgi:hypothetical protein
MVAHKVCDLEADAAPADPEKVHDVALFARATSGGGVTTGPATSMGEENADVAKATSKVTLWIKSMITNFRNSRILARART